MKENNFKLDTKNPAKKHFLKRIGALFSLSICLTGICGISGLAGLIYQLFPGNNAGFFTVSVAWKLLYTCIMLLTFVALIKMAIDEKPFSSTLVWTIRLSGFLFLIASFGIPRLHGYQSSGFEILSSGSFVLIDGSILIPGLLLVILASVIRAGFDMQKEMDEIL